MRHPVRANVPTGCRWIVEATALVTGMTVAQICGQSRGKAEVQARVLAAHVMRAHGYTQTQSGAALGGRDHTTIHWALSKPVPAEQVALVERVLAGETVEGLPPGADRPPAMPAKPGKAPRPRIEPVRMAMGIDRARKLRRDGWTLRSLASRCGVSEAYLEKML